LSCYASRCKCREREFATPLLPNFMKTTKDLEKQFNKTYNFLFLSIAPFLREGLKKEQVDFIEKEIKSFISSLLKARDKEIVEMLEVEIKKINKYMAIIKGMEMKIYLADGIDQVLDQAIKRIKKGE
jgi:hypothetical protein